MDVGFALLGKPAWAARCSLDETNFHYLFRLSYNRKEVHAAGTYEAL
jgi:hypothetical protein